MTRPFALAWAILALSCAVGVVVLVLDVERFLEEAASANGFGLTGTYLSARTGSELTMLLLAPYTVKAAVLVASVLALLLVQARRWRPGEHSGLRVTD